MTDYVDVFHDTPIIFVSVGKGKGKAHPRTGHEGPDGE